MNPFRTIYRWFRSLGQRRAVKQEIDEELRFHLEQRAAENIAAGMSAEEAAREARKRFGNLQSVREECRERRGATFGEVTWQDVRFSIRMLRKNPGFTVVAVLTLALGIGATSSVFSLVQGVLLTPPPYPKPEQVALILPERADGGAYPFACKTAQWLDWRNATNSLEVIAGYQWGFQFVMLPDGSESGAGMFVTPEYFKVIGIKPLMGREFSQADMATRGGDETTIILGYDLWRRRFHADPDIVGKVVHLSRRPPLTVVGVMPHGVRCLPTQFRANDPNYDVNAPVDFWIPLWPPDLARPTEDYCEMIGRLRDGISPAEAQAELRTIAARRAQADSNFEGMTVKAQSLTVELNRIARPILLPLIGAVGLVFLIACANAAGLQLARGLQRQQEYAIRCALGAQRAQLFRQVFTECLLLALLGGVIGIGLAAGIVKAIKIFGAHAVPRLDSVMLGWPVMPFCFAMAMVAALIAGFAPAFHAAGLNAADGLRVTRTSSVGRTERRFLRGVAVIQTALTLALLIAAGLLVQTVSNLARLRPGYDTQKVLTMSVTIPDMEKFTDFHARVLPRILALPGVKNAAMGWGLPLTGDKWIAPAEREDQPEARTLREKVNVPIRCVTFQYFDTLGMRMASGRGFEPTDAFYGPHGRTNATFVAVINEAMAERFFPNENPVGKKLILFPGRSNPATVVGVVQNARSEVLTREAGPEIYLSFWQFGFGLFVKHLVISTASDPQLLIGSVQRQLRAIDPTVAVEHIKTFQQIRAESVASQTFAMRLLVGFSLVGSVLALVGMYGVVSLSVNSRRREIAIRMAVGAQRRNVLGLFLGEGLKLIAMGLVLGTGTAIGLTRLLEALLYGIKPIDPMTFTCVAILFCTVALAACFIPARRAARIDLMTALRCE